MKRFNAAVPHTFHLAVSISLSLSVCAGGCGGRRVTGGHDATPATPPPSSLVPSAAIDAGANAVVDPLIAEAAFALPIPARAQAAESPPSGWCGETAIQEGLLYLGVWAPQRLINKAGKPVHPDLYATEIPTALSDLGVRFTPYARGRGYEAFARWVQSALEEGDPVLTGVKILPTEHPDWGLDHFVLAIGHGKKGLLVNTTWGHRDWVGDTTTPGLSLKNAFYGLRLQGVRLSTGAKRARVRLVEEASSTVKLRVTCMDAKPGQSYRVERRANDDKPVWTETITTDAHGKPIEKDLTIDADQMSRFQCAPL